MGKFALAAACAVSCFGAVGSSTAAPPARLEPAVFSPSAGDPAPTLQRARYVRVYACTARSRYAYGYWTSGYLATSRVRALRQCAIRTPRGYLCRITSCR